MKRELQFSTDARNSLKRGIDLGARMVGISYGPAGRNILMDNAKGKPSVSRNGSHLLSNMSRKDRGRIRNIRYQLSKPVSKYNRQKLEERLSMLTGSAAVIKVGAPKEMEMKEKKNRIAVSVAGMFLGTETVISIAK